MTEDIIPFARRTIELDPLVPGYYLLVGWAYLHDGRFPEALEYYGKAFRMEKDQTTTGCYGIALAYNQRHEEASRLLKEAYSMDEGTPFSHYLGLWGWALEGDREKIAELESSDIYTIAVHIAERNVQFPWLMAAYLAMLDRNDEAIDWLEKAFANGYTHHVFFSQHDPFLKKLRGMKRFDDLMEKMKKEQEDIEPLNLGPVGRI